MFSKELFGQRLSETRRKNHETQVDLGHVIRTEIGRAHV